MDLEFDVKVTPGVLYDFKIQHTYKKPITILATALGFVSIYFVFYKRRHYAVPSFVFGNCFYRVRALDGGISCLCAGKAYAGVSTAVALQTVRRGH